MALKPITVATHGLLNSPLAVASVRGRLQIPDDAVDAGGRQWKDIPDERVPKTVRAQDEQILFLIAEFVEEMDDGFE